MRPPAASRQYCQQRLCRCPRTLSALAGTEGLPEGVAAQLQAMAGTSLNSNAAGQEQIQSSLSQRRPAALERSVYPMAFLRRLTGAEHDLDGVFRAIQTGLADSKTGALNLSAGVTNVSGGVSQLSDEQLSGSDWSRCTGHPVLHLLRPVLRPFRAAFEQRCDRRRRTCHRYRSGGRRCLHRVPERWSWEPCPQALRA